MDFGGDPHPTAFVDLFRGHECVQQLVHEVETKMAVLEQQPSALEIIIIGHGDATRTISSFLQLRIRRPSSTTMHHTLQKTGTTDPHDNH